MIDLPEFPLQYTHKETGKLFHGKTLVPGELVLLKDPESGDKFEVTKSRITKYYKGSKDNRYKNKPSHCRPQAMRKKRLRGIKRNEFAQWLNGEAI